MESRGTHMGGTPWSTYRHGERVLEGYVNVEAREVEGLFDESGESVWFLSRLAAGAREDEVEWIVPRTKESLRVNFARVSEEAERRSRGIVLRKGGGAVSDIRCEPGEAPMLPKAWRLQGVSRFAMPEMVEVTMTEAGWGKNDVVRMGRKFRMAHQGHPTRRSRRITLILTKWEK